MAVAYPHRSIAAIRSELASALSAMESDCDDTTNARLFKIAESCRRQLDALGVPYQAPRSEMVANLDGGGPRAEMRRKANES